MSYFFYRCVTPSGTINEGVLDVENEEKAEYILSAFAKKVIFLKPAPARYRWFLKAKQLAHLLISRFFKVQSKDILYIFSELKSFLEAGFSLIDSLRTIQRVVHKTSFRKLLDEIIQELERGKTFSQALAKFPNYFSQSIIVSVQGGESSNQLIPVMKDISDMIQWEIKTKTRLLVSLSLPAFIFLIFFMLSYVLLYIILPKIVPFLERSGKEIPKFTLFLLDFKLFLSENIQVIGFVAGAFMTIVLGLFLFQKGRLIVDAALIRFPVFGDLYMTVMSLRMSRTLYLLYQNGIPIVPSLKISKNLFKGGLYELTMNNLAQKVEVGHSLARSFKNVSFFPVLVQELIQIGETTGSLGDKLKQIGDFYNAQLETKTALIISSIELLYLMVLSAYILAMLFGFYLPMISSVIPK